MASGASRTTIDGVLVLFGWFALLVALLQLGTGGWYAYRRHEESTTWPPAAARLTACRVHTSYDGWHGRARALHHVECVFHYDADGVARTVTSRVGDTVSVVSGQIDITAPAVSLASLQTWVRAHPDGTTQAIHYDPADPERLSLVGTDDVVVIRTPAAYVRGAATFAALGAALLACGLLVRRRMGAAVSTRNAGARELSGPTG
jgi:hypothetical protein